MTSDLPTGKTPINHENMQRLSAQLVEMRPQFERAARRASEVMAQFVAAWRKQVRP